jgi:hypothetical protein
LEKPALEWNAYHFVNDTLRDGSPVPEDGVTLKYDGKIELCSSGYHASRKVWQALEYAPGHTLCRVHCAGEVIEPNGEDKLVCTERTILARIDASDLLWDFARSCARDVLPLWNAPDVVVEYLKTGDESLRDAARAAAWDAAWDAAQKKQRARLTSMVNAAFDQ